MNGEEISAICINNGSCHKFFNNYSTLYDSGSQNEPINYILHQEKVKSLKLSWGDLGPLY